MKLQMVEALGAIAAEPGEVPDCNCSFFILVLFFFTHIHTSPPHHEHTCTQGSVCREKLFCWVEYVTPSEQLLYAADTKSALSNCGIYTSDFGRMENLSLVPPCSSVLAASSKWALFIAFCASVLNDFVRTPRSCPACGFLGRVSQWVTSVGT